VVAKEKGGGKNVLTLAYGGWSAIGGRMRKAGSVVGSEKKNDHASYSHESQKSLIRGRSATQEPSKRKKQKCESPPVMLC